MRPASLKRDDIPWQPAPGFVEIKPGVWEPENHVPTPWELAAPVVETPEDAIREYVRCKRSLPYFAFRHAWSLHVDDDSGLPQWRKFPAFPYLRLFFHEVQTPENVLVEKSRQMLLSWAWMVVFLWDITFQSNWGDMVLSRKETEVDDGGAVSTHESLLGKVRHLWMALPPYLQAPLSFHYLIVRHTQVNSFIRAESATPTAGRSRAVKRALMDEAAHIGLGETIFKGLRQAAKRGTILTSTPNGKGNLFARIRFQQDTTFKKYCTPAETPIWMADYTFKRIADIKPGDRIIGWDDSKIGRQSGRGAQNRRRMTVATVAATHALEPMPVVKLVMKSGRTIRCTGDHQWLQVRQAGNLWYAPAAVGARLSHAINIPAPCPPDLVRTAAWLGGVFDGEGSSRIISQHEDANPHVFAAIGAALSRLGFAHTVTTLKGVRRGFYINGDRHDMTRFVNWCQPVKWQQPKRGNQAWILNSNGFGTDEVVSIEPDGVEPVYALTTTTGNYVAWGYASKNSFHWTEHPEKADGLYCTCGWKMDSESKDAPQVQFRQHPCGNLLLDPPRHPEPRSPWYNREILDMTQEGVASELDINYERSRRGRVFGGFDSTRQTVDHQRWAGPMRSDEDLDAYRERYLRAAIIKGKPCVVGWDFGVGDPTSLVLGQVLDETTMHIRWLDAFEETDKSYDYFHKFVTGLWAPVARQCSGYDLIHYGDPSGKQRQSDLMSWITNLRNSTPPIVILHQPKRGVLLEWIDFVHNIIRHGYFDVSSWAAHILDGLANYHYPVDEDGNPVPGKQEPVHDKWSHVMSAMRYVYQFRWHFRLMDINLQGVSNAAIIAADDPTPPAKQPPVDSRNLNYFPHR